MVESSASFPWLGKGLALGCAANVAGTPAEARRFTPRPLAEGRVVTSREMRSLLQVSAEARRLAPHLPSHRQGQGCGSCLCWQGGNGDATVSVVSRADAQQEENPGLTPTPALEIATQDSEVWLGSWVTRRP